MDLYGIRVVGLTAENGRKVVLTLVLLLLIWLLLQILPVAIRTFQRFRTDERAEFWVRQGINLGLTLRFMTNAAGIALTPAPVTP